jgi:lysozyme
VPGKTYTDADCNALSIKHVEAHGAKLLQCIKVRITQGYYDALASWAYNVGTGAACGSTLVRLLNQGQYRAACQQLPRWNRAGGKVVRGLTNRRMAELAQCLQSIPQPAKGLA